MLKNNWIKILLLLSILAAFYTGYQVKNWFALKTEKQVMEDATVLIEKIQSVTKLITIEGFFSEIYDYQDYYGYDLTMFRKKALIRVKAKVSVGYDLEKIKITSLPESKTIVMSELPPPELLSLEHDLDYYDIQEGMFNSFTRDDYNKLNANAKEFIRQKAQESKLFDQAQLQKNKLFEMIHLLVESAGWQLKVQSSEVHQDDILPN
ncbi:MAG: DUF4230 domain-containing protein [Saprospiraceae bacterium]